MLILCMEKDKYKNRRPVYSIVKRSVENRDINFFAMRCRFNPELRYYITRLDEEKTDEEIMAMFRQNKYRKEPLFAKMILAKTKSENRQ